MMVIGQKVSNMVREFSQLLKEKIEGDNGTMESELNG